MVIKLRAFICFAIVVHLTGGIGSPKFQLVPNGIKFSLPVDGYIRSAIHFNINKPLHGIEASDYEKDFFSFNIQTGDHWEWTFPVQARQGDVIYYWMWGEKISQGETLTDQTTVLGSMAGPSTTATIEPPTTATIVPSTKTLPSSTTVHSTTTKSCNDSLFVNCDQPNVCAITSLQSLCPHTCGLCRKTCKDNAVVNCKDQHACSVHYLRSYCPLTCGICSPPLCEDGTVVECKDATVCSNSILRTFCPLTCGDCVPATKPPCTDGTLVNCSFAGVCSDSTLKEHCPLTCGLCVGKRSQTTHWIHIGTTGKPGLSQIIGR